MKPIKFRLAGGAEMIALNPICATKNAAGECWITVLPHVDGGEFVHPDDAARVWAAFEAEVAGVGNEIPREAKAFCCADCHCQFWTIACDEPMCPRCGRDNIHA